MNPKLAQASACALPAALIHCRWFKPMAMDQGATKYHFEMKLPPRIFERCIGSPF